MKKLLLIFLAFILLFSYVFVGCKNCTENNENSYISEKDNGVTLKIIPRKYNDDIVFFQIEAFTDKSVYSIVEITSDYNHEATIQNSYLINNKTGEKIIPLSEAELLKLDNDIVFPLQNKVYFNIKDIQWRNYSFHYIFDAIVSVAQESIVDIDFKNDNENINKKIYTPDKNYILVKNAKTYYKDNKNDLYADIEYEISSEELFYDIFVKNVNKNSGTDFGDIIKVSSNTYIYNYPIYDEADITTISFGNLSYYKTYQGQIEL